MKKIISCVLPLCLLGTALFSAGCGDKEVTADDYESTVLSTVGADDYGRVIEAVDSANQKPYIGMFYFAVQGEHLHEQSKGIYDVSKLLSTEQGTKELWDKDSKVAPLNQSFHWGEPLYGYYNSRDPWVIRRHIELLTMAGVDFLFFDWTNGLAYVPAMKNFLNILQDVYDSGWHNVPKVMIMTWHGYENVTETMYSGLYESGEYDDLWFKPNGKPMLATHKEGLERVEELYPDYFDLRVTISPVESYTDEQKAVGFPWIDLGNFNTNYGGVVNVSISQHNGMPFSKSVQFPELYNTNRGRGWNYDDQKNSAEDALKNVNFQHQWEYGNLLKPEIIAITGWNEWTALKLYDNVNKVFFVDTTNMEFSRDLEMMKGGYRDNAYLQLASNVRKQKGGKAQQGTKSGKVDFGKGTFEGGKTYKDFTGDALERDYDGMNPTVHYEDKTNRNDICEVRVAHDKDNVYFRVSTAGDLILPEGEDGSWMNLFIGITGSNAPNFNGYQYYLNRSRTAQTASLERRNAQGGFDTVGNVAFSAGDQYVQFAVPRSMLGAEAGGSSLYFKASDHLTDYENFDDYYVSGDCAPIGRLSFQYKMN